MSEADTLSPSASPAERFFYENAGYVVGRRAESAQRLARAEAWLQAETDAGRATVTWVRSAFRWDGDEPLPKGCKHMDVSIEMRAPCPCCGVAKIRHASLCSVAFMPGDTYPRIVEAELASELLPEETTSCAT